MPSRAETRTLLVSLQGIGNNILALPLASALSRRDGALVDMLVLSPRAAALLRRHAAVGGVIAAGGRRLALIPALRSKRYREAVFAFPCGAKSLILAAAAGIRRRLGIFHPSLGSAGALLTRRAAYRHGLHDLEHNAFVAELAGADWDLARDWPPFRPADGDVEAARQFLIGRGADPEALFVGLHPGCDESFLEKRWPERGFASLAKTLYETRGLASVVFDGPAEPGAGRRIARLAGTPVYPMDGWGDLAGALGMLAFCELFVSGDSGLMNLAAAAGVPTLAIFGPSAPARTRPFGDAHRVVAPDRPCRPCHGIEAYRGCLHPAHPCLEDVPLENVAALAGEMLMR
ncbi:MAG: glycosyltransferase family 9 protein [Deltaproteobacteria bacterium]|nr:glycosyltransferase family 9 protein [Deltaproteobacteria bacterium]